MPSIFGFVLLLYLCVLSRGQYTDEAWMQASAYLKITMNESYSACENFYKRVCGNFGRGGGGGGEEALSEFESKEKTITDLLTKAITQIQPQENATTSTFKEALRALYDGCLNSQAFPDHVLRRVYNMMGERIGYLPILGGEGDKPWHFVGAITRELGTALVLLPTVAQPDGAPNPILYIYPVSAEEGTNFSPTETRALIAALALVTGKKVQEQAIDRLVDELSAFYDDWDNVTNVDRSTVTLQNTVANLTSGSISRGGGNATGVDWNAYLDGLLPADTKKQWLADPSKAVVRIADYSLLSDLAAVLTRHSQDTVFSFAFLDALASVLLSDNASAELSIAATEPQCIQYASKAAPAAAARVLLESIKIDADNWRNEILLVASHVKAAFRYLIATMEWLDAGGKMKVNDRLDEIDVDPGLPDWITDDEKVLSKTPKFDTTRSLYENQFDIAKQKWAAMSRQLVDGLDQSDPDPDFSVNAQYQAKTVKVNLGFSLPPQFHISSPLPLKYGGLGFIIAHEYFHAFDPDVVSEEEEEDVTQFFKPSAMKEYLRRRSCIIQQYSKYCNKKVGACVSGESSVNDNIADVDGLKVAYAAYKFISQTLGGEPPVPKFVGKSGDQIFFIAFARTWCARKNKLALLLSAGASHAPPRVRVDLSVANFPAFAAAFRCPVGSTFAPLKKCSLWGASFSPTQTQFQTRRRR